MSETLISNEVIYRRTDDRALITLTSPTTRLAANSTGSALAVAIGFTFHFDGTAFTTVDLFAYGFARFAGAESSATNANLSAANTSVLLAPWWDNLETADTVGYIKTELQGTAPRRRFVVEWYCNAQSGQTGTDYDRFKFQLVLYETTDKFEFRYATAIETLGAPARGAYSATIGAKGDTSVTATNYRSFWVQDSDLGGSTTLTSNLSAYTQWPTWTVCSEPAWPMCGRLYLLDQDDINGLQDPYAEPIWYIANAVNWLYCNHRPALINISPYQQSAYATVDYVVPCTPSLDNLEYDVYVQTYTAGGGDLQIEIDMDDGSVLQPSSASWDNRVTQTALGTAAGWHEWPVFQVTFFDALTVIEDVARLVRIRASHTGAGTLILSSVLIVPKALASIHDYFALPLVGSGFLPMSIAALRQEGASIHPEWYNRAWANIARVLGDRKQMLASLAWPEAKVTAATTARPRRTIGMTPAAIGVPTDASGGWHAQTVRVRAYASNSLGGGGDITVAEQAGSSVTLEVGAASYILDEAELALVAGQPVFAITGKPDGNLSPMSVCVEWAPDLSTDDLIVGVTPAPKLEYLVSLKARIEKALGAYCMTGLATLLARGKTSANAWRVQYMVPPAVKAMRPKIARVTADTADPTDETSIYGVSSGSGALDEILIPAPRERGIDDIPCEGTLVVQAGAQTWQPNPIAAMDRLLESPTAVLMTGPVRERLEVLRGVGITLVPIRADAASL